MIVFVKLINAVCSKHDPYICIWYNIICNWDKSHTTCSGFGGNSLSAISYLSYAINFGMPYMHVFATHSTIAACTCTPACNSSVCNCFSD